MKKHVEIFFSYTIFFFLIAIILAGSFSADVLILCAIACILSSVFTVFSFKLPSKIELHLFRVLKFFCVVIVSIYVSTFRTLYCYFKRKGRIPTCVETLPLNTKGGVYRLFICQAITLTPGTVSVRRKSGSVSVLKIRTESLDGAALFDKTLKGKS